MIRIRAGALCLFVVGCVSAGAPAPGPAVLRAPAAVDAGDAYSAWFADERDGVVYFGLSDFWSAYWATGDPLAELGEPGSQQIGRFDLASETFLPPLLVREAGPEVRASVWDVLAHPNGWVYYTTFYEEMGRVHPASGAVERFSSLGAGLNELALGPDGRIFATRYGDGSGERRSASDGALVALSPEGRRLAEIRLHARDGAVTAAKSVAFDPASGHVFVNADVIRNASDVQFASFELTRDLSLVSARLGDPELLFAAFAPDGFGVRVVDDGGRLGLWLREPGREPVRLDLGPRPPQDFAQDVHFAPDGTAAIAFWSGRIELVRARAGGLERARVDLERPSECLPPEGRSLVYSAFVTPDAVYATLYCGATILRAPLPADWQPVAPPD